ncbi:MAG TPA: DUF4249 domain-containing protein [Bacteroidetes bacterium]|nr:DUF4249 domain-containing protein [Bacteroidota bacterium]
MMRYLFFIIAIINLISCSKEITIDLPTPEEKFVVEGYIENGNPPAILLTRSQPYFSSFSLDQIDDLFVKGASITLSCEGQVYNFIEFPIPIDSNTTIYIYSIPTIIGEVGKKYDIKIEAEGKILTASTHIPEPVAIDSLYWIQHPEFDLGNDSLVTLMALFKDPDTSGNFYRYFTKRNNEEFKPGYFGSVFDDLFWNGIDIDAPFPRGQNKTEDFDRDTYSYFFKGDHVFFKLASIDQITYDFWRTLEQDDAGSGNPFGTATKILSNIEGGLGIWSGYGISIDTLTILD